ncbi:hypothetical protein Pst134EB_029780 [Puccinia striiformis f. sp. tritici]|nr:hypothetical protein Pst134EB_029780 [Puccinia striiformis f. sp. tritici]
MGSEGYVMSGNYGNRELLGMTECKSVNTPLSVAVQLQDATENEKEDFKKLKINYRTHTGILNFLACRTRPDLAPAVSILSRFNQAPGIITGKKWYIAGNISRAPLTSNELFDLVMKMTQIQFNILWMQLGLMILKLEFPEVVLSVSGNHVQYPGIARNRRILLYHQPKLNSTPYQTEFKNLSE